MTEYFPACYRSPLGVHQLVVLKWIGAIFAAIGTIFVAIAVMVAFNEASFIGQAKSASADVLAVHYRVGSGRGSYRLDLRFTTPNGNIQTATVPSATNPPAVKQGDRVEVLFDPGDPSHVQINSFTQLWTLPLIFGAIGLIFAVIGWAFLVRVFVHWRRARWLRQNGQKVVAKVVRVDRNWGVTVNGHHPWRIVAGWVNPLTGQSVEFVSDDVGTKPAGAIPDHPVVVYVHPIDDRRYAVDLSSLRGST